MRRISKFSLASILGMLLMNLVLPNKAEALKNEYLRNGECYMLIGIGDYKGIYRMNNPVRNVYSLNKLVIPGSSFNDTLGFNVDSTRNIYTFTEVIDDTFKTKNGFIYRQVLDDSVSEYDSDMGTGQLHHTDSRNSSERNRPIYRTVKKGGSRDINRKSSWNCSNTSHQVAHEATSYYWTGSGKNRKKVYYTYTYYTTETVNCSDRSNQYAKLCQVYAISPGASVNPPKNYELPKLSGGKNGHLKLEAKKGKKWYKIPNRSWFSSWNKNGKGYMCYCDDEQEKRHHYMKWTWPNRASDEDASYSGHDTGNEVAYASEIRTLRQFVCGCLDSCSNDGGSGTSEAKAKKVAIAMQPPMIGGGGNRIYSLAREEKSSEYELKLARDGGSPADYDRNVRGYPDEPDSEWIGISLKNKSEDYVYIMGPDTIKKWYAMCWGNTPASMNITAVGVSNQWNQKGGIVYAYDKSTNSIYKFDCIDSKKSTLENDPGVSNSRFLSISVKDAINSMGGDGENCDVDDIKADGFGSVFFGLSFPSKDTTSYKPEQHFQPLNAVHMCVVATDLETGYHNVNIVFEQEYGKVVFERNINDGKIRKVGSRPYAKTYYNAQITVSPECYAKLNELQWPNSSWLNIVTGYASSDPKMDVNSSNWRSFIHYGNGNCSHSGKYQNKAGKNDAGQCRLAVINIPTPPKVLYLGHYQSFLDIIGPYKSYPYPDYEQRNTNQRSGLAGTGSTLDLNQVYFYMVENYPLDDENSNTGQDPRVQEDWDADGRQSGFISTIMDRKPYRPGTHDLGVKYQWKTWMVMDLYGNCVCKQVQSNDVKDGNYYNFIYSPVFGKFIMTCKVQYNWNNFDLMPFGGNIEDAEAGKYPGVRNLGTWALPVAKDSLTHQTAQSRLEQIMNTFDYKGKKFMKKPFDKDGKDIQVDYSKIIDEPNGEYLAMEPITVGTDVESSPEPVYQIAEIQRCDDISDWQPASNYVHNNSYWNSVPSDTKYFGIKAGEKYNWRINYTASQTNMIDLTYLRNEMVKPSSPFFVNKNPDFKFQNNGQDLRWADNKILVSAKLIYKVPNGSGGYKEINLPLKQGVVNSARTGNSTSSDYEYDFEVNDNKNDIKNNMVYFTTSGDLPPTDPMDAVIQINMRRQYQYEMWAYRDGSPIFCSPPLPGWLQITGQAKIRIMDVDSPKIVWTETKPNNLFGITGTALKAKDGPRGKENPDYVTFTIKDNNPWEAVENPTGISLNEHIINYAYNLGAANCEYYCSANDTMKQLYTSLKPANINIKQEIEKAKKSHLPSSHLNYKPVFSRSARDIRLMFETVQRTSSRDPRENGKVILGKADSLFYNIAGRNFSDDSSDYAIHYRSGKKYEKQLHTDTFTYSEVIGNTKVYSATMQYKLAVAGIKTGTYVDQFGKQTATNIVPDGYANNTPGYRPYKFFISITDSSGNFIRDREFNLALNVKDDIPPVGFGSVVDYKNECISYYPNKEEGPKSTNENGLNNAPIFSVKGQNCFVNELDPRLVRATTWLPSKNNVHGYINDVDTNEHGEYKTYFGVKSLGDRITSGVTDNIFLEQARSGISPMFVEDNVECDFAVYVSDNCGSAKATLTLKYFDTDGRNGSQDEKTGTVKADWTSAARVDSYDSYIASSTPNIFHTVFKGRTEQFPMAIPITIYAEDNARDWDYYNGGSVNLSGNWEWGNTIRGKDNHNSRTFKTSLPVYGSNLDVRVIDKTLKNRK